jgi:hypothetical protein
VPMSALRTEIAHRGDAVIATNAPIAVALAVVDATRRCVLYGADALPSRLVEYPNDSAAVVSALCADLGASADAAQCVLVDVATARANHVSELRFAVLLQPGLAPRQHLDGNALRWLKVDFDAPFYTPDWMLLTEAIQELLASLGHPR